MKQLLLKVFRSTTDLQVGELTDDKIAHWSCIGDQKFFRRYSNSAFKDTIPFKSGPKWVSLVFENKRYTINGLHDWNIPLLPIRRPMSISCYLASSECITVVPGVGTMKYGFRRIQQDPDIAWLKTLLINGGVDLENSRWKYAREFAGAVETSRFIIYRSSYGDPEAP